MAEAKFADECLRLQKPEREIRATPIQTRLERENKSGNSLSNSRYFLEGAKQILIGDTPYLVFALGFFAMEHAATALVAMHGYSITEHKCAQIFFSKMLNREDLAKALSRAYNARIAFIGNNLNFRMFQKIVRLFPNSKSLFARNKVPVIKVICYNYRNNLSDYKDKAEAEEFLQKEVIPFIEEIEKLLKET